MPNELYMKRGRSKEIEELIRAQLPSLSGSAVTVEAVVRDRGLTVVTIRRKIQAQTGTGVGPDAISPVQP